MRENKCLAEQQRKHWSRFIYVVLFTVKLLLGSECADAQADFEKGFQAYQSYHGSDFDTVNLANGNLILNIPLLSYEQRGGLPPVVISIRSNSTTFQSTPPYVNGPLDTQQHEVPSGVIGSPWGQPHVVISPGGLSWKEERIVTSSHTGTGGPEYLTRFVAVDESGATHSLGGSVANLIQGLVPNIRYSVDGSGLMLQPGTAQTGPVLVDRQGNTGGLVDVHGNAITLRGQCATAPGSGDLFNAAVASWQGYAHGTASASSIVDSVGRVIPNPSYLPPAGAYSCLVDLDATYHPAAPSTSGCETWNFPAQGLLPQSGIQSNATVPLVFCYKQIAINAQIPIPLAVGSPVPGSGQNTSSCAETIIGNANDISCETINEIWWVLSSVTLPNLTQWQFSYDSYGQVKSIIMPTGATVSYDYQTRLACGNPPGQIPVSGTPVWPYSNIMSSRMVTSRTVSLNNSNDPTMTWKYVNALGSGWASSPNSGIVTVNDPAGNDVVHTFSLIGQCVCGPYETKTQYYQGLAAQGGTLLKQVDTQYSETGTDYANPTNFSNYISVGVFANVVTTTLPTSTIPVVSQNTYTYDELGTYQDYVGNTHPYSFGQLLKATESAWGNNSNAPGPILRTTLHSHLWQANWTYYAANLVDLPCLDTVIIGSTMTTQYGCTSTAATSSIASQTSYRYDESGYSYLGSLGNPTSVSHLLLGGTNPEVHNVYSSTSFGMPTQKIDANGNTTLLTYDSTGLFLSEIQHPTTSGVQHVEYPTYDGNTGLLISSIDENTKTTNYQYDSMRRLIHIDFPDFGWETYTYNDLAPQTYPQAIPVPAFTYVKALSGSQTYTAMGFVDELGRNRQTQVVDPEGDIKKDTTYDLLGRVSSVSNPYRTKADATYGLTSYAYDALSRKLYQYEQDGVNYLQWTYAGNVTTSYDERHHAWQRTSDALGRLTAVVEPGVINTTYSYDTLGNLLCADQWGTSSPSASCTSSVSRSFSYDSLSRLLTSTNPETGTICYGQGNPCTGGYDLNGNLLAKTDARGITVGYSYDALNRLLSKSYRNDPTGTPSSCYQYDQLGVSTSGMIGRLTAQWTQAGNCPTTRPVTQAGSNLTQRLILAYDPMGRILSEQQCTFSNCSTSNPYTPSYDYDLAGNVIHHTSGITSGTGSMSFTNCYDSVSRLSLVVGVSTQCQSPSAPLSLFASPSYSPAGGLTAATFGSGLNLWRTYDVRLRINSETDTGGLAQTATPGSATFQILQR